MRTTCVSWFPLASSDPVPGDADGVQRAAERYGEVAEHIGTAADRLLVVSKSPDMQSRAVAAVRSRAEEVSTEVERAKSRYEAIARALGEYARSLRAAQDAADDLLARAVAVQHRIDNATTERTLAARALASLDPSATDADRRRVQGRLATARTTVSDAEVELQHLRDELEQVVRDRDAAAQRAIDAIGSAQAADRLDDGWWQDWGLDLARSVSEVAGNVAGACGIAALLLGWVPILGQVLALTAAIAGALALIADIGLAFDGEKDWMAVVFGIVGVVTFGAGNAVARGANVLRTSLKPTASAAARLTGNSRSPVINAVLTQVKALKATIRNRPVTVVTVRGAFANGWRAVTDTYMSAARAALAQVRGATSPAHRLLAAAGHGELVADTSAYALLQSVTRRPKALERIVPLATRGYELQTRALMLVGVDASLAGEWVTGKIDDAMRPPRPTARERLAL
ncbi:hypothetical protein LFM56_15770 [Cellulomonas iranensis]|uniref:hypothetical protein n=1 Tax=Cellulomonas iranensis TaxID=76862 RepID=UPI001CF1E230|nr:hypothetical protein [Cellulomonas iranensis]UCN14313.1 hypothetical protein LFM56_15770 [Cellulomonas iranensis]